MSIILSKTLRKDTNMLENELNNAISQYNNYNELLNHWLKTKKMFVKQSTYVVYKNIITTHISNNLGHLQLSELTSLRLESYALELLKNGRTDGKGGLSNKSVIDICTLIKSTLKFAKSHGESLYCDFNFLTIKKTHSEMRVLSREETTKLVNAIFNNIDSYKLGILICLFTGVRIGELCALQWKDISFIDNYIRIERTMQRIQVEKNTNHHKTRIIITKPKTPSAIRIIPISEKLLNNLLSFRNEPQEYVVSTRKGKYVEPRTMQNHFKKCLDEAGIDDANFHALRHTFATRCIETGCDAKTLSELLGHSSVKITLDKYVHSSLEQKRKNISKLNFIV